MTWQNGEAGAVQIQIQIQSQPSLQSETMHSCALTKMIKQKAINYLIKKYEALSSEWN